MMMCAALLVATACNKEKTKTAGVPTVRLATVEKADWQDTLRHAGRVRASGDVALSFRVGGQIESMLVREGDHVGKGQLLAMLDDADYRVQLSAAEAEYCQVKAEAERVMALYGDSGTTANAYDKAVYGLQQMTAKLRHCEDELAYTKLYAPFGGTVQECLLKAHETVGAGMPIMTMVSDGAPEVELNLPAADRVRLYDFAAYSCTFDVFPNEEYPLTLLSIAPKANANQLYTMRLQLATDGKPLPSPGMNTMVTILCTTAGETATYAVPTNALLEQDGHSRLFVFSAGDSTVHAVDVQLVRLLGDGRSIISSEALGGGESIVVSGIHHVNTGDKVRPLPPMGNTNVGELP